MRNEADHTIYSLKIRTTFMKSCYSQVKDGGITKKDASLRSISYVYHAGGSRDGTSDRLLPRGSGTLGALPESWALLTHIVETS